MYKKGTAVELQFSLSRLNDGAGDPCWVDLTHDEARDLLNVLTAKLANADAGTEAPAIFSLPGPEGKMIGITEPQTPAKVTLQTGYKQWVCVICGWIYDEALGCPQEGIAAGTRWEDIPQDWRCPLCDVGKDDFAMMEF